MKSRAGGSLFAGDNLGRCASGTDADATDGLGGSSSDSGGHRNTESERLDGLRHAGPSFVTGQLTVVRIYL